MSSRKNHVYIFCLKDNKMMSPGDMHLIIFVFWAVNYILIHTNDILYIACNKWVSKIESKSHHIDRQVQTSPGDSLSYRNHRVYHMEQTQHSDTGTGSQDRTSRRWDRESRLGGGEMYNVRDIYVLSLFFI